MKSYLLFLLSVIAVTVVFSGCRNCYPCLASGENFDLTVTPGETVTYVNDSNIEKALSVTIFGGWPDDEYCGRVGSKSYGKCFATTTARIENIQDSLAVCYECSTGNNDNVEQIVTRLVGVARLATVDIWLISIKGGVGTTVKNGTVTKIDNITIGGNQYSDLYVYENSQAGINECTYFVYSLSYGVLKFSIRMDDSVENWVLVQ